VSLRLPDGAELPVFDVHQHYGALVMSSAGAEERVGAGDQDDHSDRLERMQRLGVDAALLMPVNRYLRPRGAADTRDHNDRLAAYRALDPARFPVAVGVAEPLHGSAGLDEIRRVRDEHAFVGISSHARWQGVAADDPWILRQLELMGELSMLPFVHAHSDSTLESPSIVANLAAAFPDLPIVVTDAGSSPAQLIAFTAELERHENLHLETSLIFHPRQIEQLVARFGADRLVFGSDLYSRGGHCTLNSPEALAEAGLDSESLRAVLHGNAQRLLAWAGANVELAC
jgi:predicted TIM-barrel fold metal-dependent hydrolase